MLSAFRSGTGRGLEKLHARRITGAVNIEYGIGRLTNGRRYGSMISWRFFVPSEKIRSKYWTVLICSVPPLLPSLDPRTGYKIHPQNDSSML